MRKIGTFTEPSSGEGPHLRLALLQLNTPTNDLDANIAAAAAAIDQAAATGADLIVLPEFFNLSYFAQVWDTTLFTLAESQHGPTMSMVRARAKQYGVHICATIYERRDAGTYFDTAFMIDPCGKTMGTYEKVHPAAVKSLEKVYFRPGSHFPVWDVNGVKVSAIICYDHYFPEAARSAMLNGAELLLGPFAAPKSTTGYWREMMTIRAFENGLYMAPCNKVGREGEWDFRGASMVVDPTGQILASADEENECMVLADVKPQRVIDARSQYPMVRDRVPHAYEAITRPY